MARPRAARKTAWAAAQSAYYSAYDTYAALKLTKLLGPWRNST